MLVLPVYASLSSARFIMAQLQENIQIKIFNSPKESDEHNFFSKNFSLLSRPLLCIKVICIETAYFT